MCDEDGTGRGRRANLIPLEPNCGKPIFKTKPLRRSSVGSPGLSISKFAPQIVLSSSRNNSMCFSSIESPVRGYIAAYNVCVLAIAVCVCVCVCVFPIVPTLSILLAKSHKRNSGLREFIIIKDGKVEIII